MHFTITKENFYSGLSTVLRAAASKSPLLITTGIFIKAHSDAIELTGTDLDIMIRYRVPPLEIFEEGEVVIPGKQIGEIVRRLNDEKIEIKSDGPGITVAYAAGEARISGFPAEEFPLISNSTVDGPVITIDTGFRNALRSVLYAASRDELRPVFTGIHFEVNEGLLTIAATDSHRLAVSEIAVNTNESISSIIPAKALREFDKSTAHLAEKVTIKLGKTTAVFHVETLELYTRLIEGSFPLWRSAVPITTGLTRLRGETGPLINAVERAQVMTSSETPSVLLKVTGESLTVHSRSEVGGVKEKVPLQVEGEDMEISFNTAYFLEALRAIPANTVHIDFYGSGGPAIIRVPGHTGYVALVLPLRIVQA